jgi:hypothetical protein
MFERAIDKDSVVEVLRTGEVIAEYPDDEPYPSYLMLGFVRGHPLHVVVAAEKGPDICHVVTAYDPDPAIWDNSFKNRR